MLVSIFPDFQEKALGRPDFSLWLCSSVKCSDLHTADLLTVNSGVQTLPFLLGGPWESH